MNDIWLPQSLVVAVDQASLTGNGFSLQRHHTLYYPDIFAAKYRNVAILRAMCSVIAAVDNDPIADDECVFHGAGRYGEDLKTGEPYGAIRIKSCAEICNWEHQKQPPLG